MREAYKESQRLNQIRACGKAFMKDLRKKYPNINICAIDSSVLKRAYKNNGYIKNCRYPNSIKRLLENGLIEQIGVNTWKLKIK